MNLVTSAQKFPDHTAPRMDDQVLTFGRLDEATGRLAQLMISLGIGPGDRIGLRASRSAWSTRTARRYRPARSARSRSAATT